MNREQKDVDGLPVVGQAKIWSKSKLIEDIRVNQHAILKTDFDRDYPGELNEFDVILAEDVAQLIQDKIDEIDYFLYTPREACERLVDELLDNLQEGEEVDAS